MESLLLPSMDQEDQILSHFYRIGKWFGFLIGYPGVMYLVFDRQPIRGRPLWIFLNTIASGFSLTYEQFYFEVVFPILVVMLYWFWITAPGRND